MRGCPGFAGFSGLNIITGIFITLLVSLSARADACATAEPVARCTTVEYFYRTGCPHCDRAARFLEQLQRDHSGISIISLDVFDENTGQPRFIEQINRFSIDRPGVPLMVMCDRFILGFDNARTTGEEIKTALGLSASPPETASAQQGVELPLFGRIDVNDYGLTFFTIVIGLVDGFNPCAMWVLLFLLTLLVNMKSRSRIIIVAGTFVLVSGVVYFAFMAAWLNLFLIMGFSRLMQLAVGIVALLIGVVHIKDYIAFGRGLSLSIPQSAKPGLYARMRDVIYARNLLMSLVAVVILAVLVNMIELLCTAGLPAVYTHILTAHDLPAVSYYAYLLLYNLAYIFDDALMVSIAVYTLNRTRMQERAGRILKLISGCMILLLGIILIVFPDVLI